MIDVRQVDVSVADTLGDIMWDAVHIAPSAYTAAQRAAWVPRPPKGATWVAKLNDQQIWLAEISGVAVGFLTLAEGAYVDFAFVRASAQKRGVFRDLLDAAEKSARDQAASRLWTHASLTAQPAFARAGFHVIRHETVERRGETLHRAEMEKRLT